MYTITWSKDILNVLIFTIICSFGYGQNIYSNSITGTNPNTLNPYTTGDIVDSNITVSGIGRGPGISGANANDRYNASGWQYLGLVLDSNEYFEFTLTPNGCNKIDFTSFEFSAQSNISLGFTGPTTVAVRSSLDGYANNIGGTHIISLFGVSVSMNVDLSSATYQNIKSAITFRVYGWGSILGGGSLSINDFTFNGVVSPTTTTWSAGSWSSGLPTICTNVIIDGNYNTGAGGSQISFSANSLTVNAGYSLNVDNNTYVEVENDVIVNGELFIDTKGSFVQNNDAGTFTVNSGGVSQVFKYTADKQAWYYYTYWSSPVDGAKINNVLPFTSSDRRFWFNAANYLDINGDNIDDNGNDWTIAVGTDDMIPGVGYAATSGPFGLYPGPDSATFIGPFNTGDISTGIVYNAANFNGSWNLIGNPYPSAVDFIAFQAANSTVIDGAAYFWSQSLPPLSSNPGNQNLNFSQNDYATYTIGSGGVAGASGVIPNQYIPSCQSFFIAGLANGNATFTNAMRMTDGTSNMQFFKSSTSKNGSSSLDNKFWINLTSEIGIFNQILVAYTDGATNSNDGLSYDAPKLLTVNSPASLYSIIEDSNNKFAVQGKASNSLNMDEIVYLGYVNNIDLNTIYTLSISQIQGSFLTGNPIYLKDKLLNKVHNLSESNYNFTSAVGEFNNRFVVMFNNNALYTDDVNLIENILKIMDLDNDRVEFTISNNLKIKNVSIYDLLGRELYEFKGQNSSEIYNLTTLKNTIYIAKVTLSNGVIITKKFLKK